MSGEGAGGLAQRPGDVPGGHSLGPFPHQQAEGAKSGVLGQSGKALYGGFHFHISIIAEISIPVKPGSMRLRTSAVRPAGHCRWHLHPYVN
jgi:hypothetical protein